MLDARGESHALLFLAVLVAEADVTRMHVNVNYKARGPPLFVPCVAFPGPGNIPCIATDT